jgi:exodeoxyribonuclease V beta subunit
LVARHVAERKLAASSLLVVTFTRAAAAELRDRTRRVLVQALHAVVSGQVPADQPWMSTLLAVDGAELRARELALEAAVSSFDDATVTTIHGFCQQALGQLGLRSGTPLDSELSGSTSALVDEVCRDLVVSALVLHPSALSWTSKIAPDKVLKDLSNAVKAVLGNPGATLLPDTAAGVKVRRGDTLERLAAWVALVHRAVDEVVQRRATRGELGYDDLVGGLRNAVCDPVNGPAVVKALNDRYHLVLVDEFQDTDPVQWQIFETAFTDHLVTVGDPKQAIYRFRGADVQAYLRATAGAPTVHLGTNFRSDADLVAATNTLIDGVALGDPRIVGSSVAAAPSSPERALSGAPITIRCVPDHPDLLTARKREMSAPLARQVILSDLVKMVVDLLDVEHLELDGGAQKVNPGHIAVLVPSHGLANDVVRALARAGVPSVRTRTGSVFGSRAALEWRLLLSALERPSHPPTVRGAGLGSFLRAPSADLAPLGVDADRRIAELQQQCAMWADSLTKMPFLAWYDQVRSQSQLVETLLARPTGERELTDLDHVAELLSTELVGRGTTAAAALRCLDRLSADAERIDDADPQMRRIDSDAQAVQVTTVHGSKGLEYPIVLLPFPFHVTRSDGTSVYNDDAGTRIVDIASGQDWEGVDPHTRKAGRKHHLKVGQRGDALRLLYVALTRAQHRTALWWAPVSDAKQTAINVLLFDRDDVSAPLGTVPELSEGPRGGLKSDLGDVPNPDSNVEVQRRLEVLSARSGGRIEAGECEVGAAPPVWAPLPSAEPAVALAIADAGGRTVHDPAWRRWSFSSISSGRPDDGLHGAPISGGADEPDDDPSDLDDVSQPQGPVMPWADLRGGKEFGVMVHSVLERIDPTSAALELDLRREVTKELRNDRLDVGVTPTVTGLSAAIDTPLGPLFGGRRLADIPVADRLAELDFDLPLVSAKGQRVTPAHIGRVMLHTLDPADPQLAYAQQLADERFPISVAGYLQGSIDAVLRVPGPDGSPRFVVVDYKTNRLHQPGDAQPLETYHPDLLPAAMAHSDYPLQALLYSVAVHRYLRWRLPGYTPEVHLGGIGYLFLRGMVGQATPVHLGCPYGVFAWQPPAATVLGIDRLFAEGAS